MYSLTDPFVWPVPVFEHGFADKNAALSPFFVNHAQNASRMVSHSGYLSEMRVQRPFKAS